VDEAKKQKVLIGVLAACIFGVGGVWFITRDTGPKKQTTARSSLDDRQRRGADAPALEKQERKTRETSAERTTKVERVERDPAERASTDRKKRAVGKKKIKKKTGGAPAA